MISLTEGTSKWKYWELEALAQVGTRLWRALRRLKMRELSGKGTKRCSPEMDRWPW